MRPAALILALISGAAACRSADRETGAATSARTNPAAAPGPSPLHDRVAVDLRLEFDRAVDFPRFVVALSPT